MLSTFMAEQFMTAARLYVSHESSTRKVGVAKKRCSRCGGQLEKHRVGKQRYCLKCHAEHMRMTRPAQVKNGKHENTTSI